jgi:ABC-type transport system substrate-binding protein
MMNTFASFFARRRGRHGAAVVTLLLTVAVTNAAAQTTSSPPSEAPPDTTRAALLAAERDAQAAAPVAASRSRLERALSWYDDQQVIARLFGGWQGVQVVGTGAGALLGAIRAADLGLRTLVIEKTDLVGGTSATSGGAIWVPCNHDMKRVGIDDDLATAFGYVKACARGQASDERILAYLESAPELARYLDGIGVKDVDGDGLRERPDGTPLELIVDIPSSDKLTIDSMDFIQKNWQDIGLKTTLNIAEGSIIDQRANAGEIMIRAWGSAAAWGLISAPTVWTPVEAATWSMAGVRIGQNYVSLGKEGVAPRPGSMLEKLQKAYTDLISTADPAERERKLLDAYRIHIDEGPITIGTVGEHPSPVIVKNNVHNVPETGLVASWDLGFPGTADPEQFFFR